MRARKHAHTHARERHLGGTPLAYPHTRASTLQGTGSNPHTAVPMEQLRSSDLELDEGELDGQGPVVRSLEAEGRVAMPGFVNPSWIPCTLHFLAQGSFMCAWRDSQSPVVYHARADL